MKYIQTNSLWVSLADMKKQLVETYTGYKKQRVETDFETKIRNLTAFQGVQREVDDDFQFDIFISNDALSNDRLRAHVMKSLIKNKNNTYELILKGKYWQTDRTTEERKDLMKIQNTYHEKQILITKDVTDQFIQDFLILKTELTEQGYKLTKFTFDLSNAELLRNPFEKEKLQKNHLEFLKWLTSEIEFNMEVFLVMNTNLMESACTAMCENKLSDKLSFLLKGVQSKIPICNLTQFPKMTELEFYTGHVIHIFRVVLNGSSHKLRDLRTSLNVLIVPGDNLYIPSLFSAHIGVASDNEKQKFLRSAMNIFKFATSSGINNTPRHKPFVIHVHENTKFFTPHPTTELKRGELNMHFRTEKDVENYTSHLRNTFDVPIDISIQN